MASRSDDAVTTIPTGLYPRLLNMTSQTMDSATQAVLFKARHFSLGVAASQEFLYLAEERFADLRDELEEFAPHPFDHYTLSFWSGEEAGAMVEWLIVVSKDAKTGLHKAGSIVLRWGSEEIPNGFWMMDRQEVFSSDLDSLDDTIRHEVEMAQGTWNMIDAFRLILAKPGAIVINRGEARKAKLFKGKRYQHFTASEITIDLDKVKFRTTAFRTGYGKTPRLYEYRAHLCHSRLQPGCQHVWEATETSTPEHPRWECVKCAGRRWHRRAGVRGDPTKGVIQHRYKVIKGERDVTVPA